MLEVVVTLKAFVRCSFIVNNSVQNKRDLSPKTRICHYLELIVKTGSVSGNLFGCCSCYQMCQFTEFRYRNSRLSEFSRNRDRFQNGNGNDAELSTETYSGEGKICPSDYRNPPKCGPRRIRATLFRENRENLRKLNLKSQSL